MPKRSRSGVVSSPVRVVAPMSVNGGRSSVSVRAAGALADDDVEPEVLERRVEDLLDRAVQPVDLVDEQDVARLEAGEDRGDVALPLERGPGDACGCRRRAPRGRCARGRLAEPGRADEQHVVERLAARLRRVERDRELLLDPLLADEVVEPARPQRALELVLLGPTAGARN